MMPLGSSTKLLSLLKGPAVSRGTAAAGSSLFVLSRGAAAENGHQMDLAGIELPHICSLCGRADQHVSSNG